MIAVLTASSASGQSPPRQPSQRLPPGQSAGVKTAQQGIAPSLALVGASAIIALVVVTTAGSGGKGSQPNSQSVPATVP